MRHSIREYAIKVTALGLLTRTTWGAWTINLYEWNEIYEKFHLRPTSVSIHMLHEVPLSRRHRRLECWVNRIAPEGISILFYFFTFFGSTESIIRLCWNTLSVTPVSHCHSTDVRLNQWKMENMLCDSRTRMYISFLFFYSLISVWCETVDCGCSTKSAIFKHFITLQCCVEYCKWCSEHLLLVTSAQRCHHFVVWTIFVEIRMPVK